MAQNIDKIIDLLHEMQRTNDLNANSFNRLLAGIGEKLETAESKSSYNLIQNYIKELAKSVDSKYSTTLSKFEDVEKALRAVYNNQNTLVQNSDLKEFFDMFSNNMNNFYTEARQEKAILAGVESKLEDIKNNKTDKEDIMRTISLLRNDFENINISYKNTIDSVNSTLKSILSNLMALDPLKTNENVIAQIEIMYKAINDIISQMEYLNDHDEKMEKILSNVATNEDLKITKEIIDSIIIKTEKIEEKLTKIADKEDVSYLQKALTFINDKTEETDVRKQTENLLVQTDEIKQLLSKVAKNVENTPNADELFESLKKLHAQIEQLTEDVNLTNVKSDINDVYTELDYLKNELEIIKNIITDINEVLITKVYETLNNLSFDDISYEIKNAISEMLTQLPQKKDIEKILESSAVEYQSLLNKSEEIAEKLEKLPKISETQEEIKENLSKLNFNKEFSYIYDKTSSIENWLLESNIKENSEKIAQQMELASTADDVAQIQFKANEIVEALEKLSQSYDVESVSENINSIEKKIEEILTLLNENIANDGDLEISEKLSDLERSISEIVSRGEFNEFIEEIKYCISKLSTSTGSCTANIEEMQRLQKKIEDKLNQLDFSATEAMLEGKFNELNEKILELSENSGTNQNIDKLAEEIEDISLAITQIPEIKSTIEDLQTTNEKILRNNTDIENDLNTISDYMQNNLPADNHYIKTQLEDIRSLIEANASDFDGLGEEKDINLESVKEYLSDLKNLLQNKSAKDIYSQVQDIEDSLVNNQTFNESAFSQILEKLDNFRMELDNFSTDNTLLVSSIKELSSLQNQLTKIENQIKENEKTKDITNNPQDAYITQIENFLADKLSEINENITSITSQSNEQYSSAITQQTKLLEEKTTALQNMLNELSISDIDNPEFENKIQNVNENLSDFKDELQLVSTDITESLNTKSAKILEELTPIKETLEKIYENSDINNLKNKLGDLHNSIIENDNLTIDNSGFEDLYGRLTEKFIENENNIKDFILSDTDSIIIKLDNLKDYVEKSLDSFVPPDTQDFSDLNNFISSIKDFQARQEELLNNTVNSIKNEITSQNSEIKSLLEIANNHEDILNAIEDLKTCFKSKIIKTTSDNAIQTDETSNFFSEDALDELKIDFENFTKKIETLSADNIQINTILNAISDKLDKINFNSNIKSKNDIDDIDNIDDFDVTEEDIFGKDRFDFVEAFDILQDNIRTLAYNVEQLKAERKNDKTPQIPALDNNNLIMSINTKADTILKALNNNWADEIKNYIESGNKNFSIQLDEISAKLDILAADNGNSDVLTDISDTVYNVEDSIKELSQKLETSVPDAINSLKPAIEQMSDFDKKISSMIEELNTKIIEISTKDSGVEELNEIKELIVEQKDYIGKLEPNEKLDAFKKCLDELSNEINDVALSSNLDNEKIEQSIKEMKDSLMSAVVTIFDQVSFLEETEDIKDFVEEKTDVIEKKTNVIEKKTDEITKNIAEINKQLQQLSSYDSKTDYNYSMQDIETDLAKLRLALNDLQTKDENERKIDFSEITDKLHSITSSVDSLTQDEMKELKSEISTLKEQTQFLIATSDKSYNALNTGIEDFGEMINDSLTGKVDKLAQMLEYSVESDKVIKQSLIYVGEWIDSVSENINKISSNSDEINNITDILDGLKTSINEQITNAIEEKFELWQTQIQKVEKQFSKIENLENQFIEQQNRIDRLEINIDKLLSIIENLDDPSVNKKIDKIEKQLSKLGTNIEKLASYVD